MLSANRLLRSSTPLRGWGILFTVFGPATGIVSFLQQLLVRSNPNDRSARKDKQRKKIQQSQVRQPCLPILRTFCSRPSAFAKRSLSPLTSLAKACLLKGPCATARRAETLPEPCTAVIQTGPARSTKFSIRISSVTSSRSTSLLCSVEPAPRPCSGTSITRTNRTI